MGGTSCRGQRIVITGVVVGLMFPFRSGNALNLDHHLLSVLIWVATPTRGVCGS